MASFPARKSKQWRQQPRPWLRRVETPPCGQSFQRPNNLRVIAFSGTVKEQPWVHMEILEGSYGGRHGLDGMDAVDTLYANTRNNPVEDIESHLPLRVNRYELREDVIAPGEWRGGIGSVRVFTYLTNGGFSVEGDGQKHRPWGFDGGTDGLPGELIMETKAGRAWRSPRRCPTRRPRAVTVCLPTVPAATAVLEL
jgi:N-methylhydantoinase B